MNCGQNRSGRNNLKTTLTIWQINARLNCRRHVFIMICSLSMRCSICEFTTVVTNTISSLFPFRVFRVCWPFQKHNLGQESDPWKHGMNSCIPSTRYPKSKENKKTIVARKIYSSIQFSGSCSDFVGGIANKLNRGEGNMCPLSVWYRI